MDFKSYKLNKVKINMSNTNQTNTFKLLAIRPLEGTSSDLLKGLKINCIYRFYNEYEFINCVGKNINDQRYKILAEKNEILGYKYQNIEDVKYSPIVPYNLYGSNINISAIVGENGSGKSTLLEILYLYVYNLSKKYYDDKELKNFEKLNVEIVVIIDGVMYIFRMIHSEDVHKDSKLIDINIFAKKIEKSKFINVEVSKELLSKFYTNVINYSIYGLNSNVSGDWLNHLFYKNDGYQVPIVINPFRRNGIIDINSEYNLAQQRLVLNYYVIKNKKLLHNVTLHSVNYTIDILKNQFFKIEESIDEGGRIGKDLIVNRLLQFIEINLGGLSRGYFERFVNFLFESFDIDNIDIRKNLVQFFDTNVNLENFRKTDNNFIIKNNVKLENEDYMYLCILYIFKKLTKITYSYDDFKIYNSLFTNEWSGDYFGVGTLKLYNEILINLDIDSLEILNNDPNKKKILSKKIYDYYLDKLPELILNVIDKNEVEFTINKLVEDRINQIDFNKNLNDLVNEIFGILNEELDSYRDDIFKSYLIKLKNNNDHITFKLKQALNYFKNNQFDKIISSEFNVVLDKYILNISENFIGQKHNIEDVPLALFEPNIKVQKNEDIPYEFNRMSSGEQQMIHSLLNVVYHTFNINSKNNSYKNINLIYDEVELYFHPEYQRSFISNLLQSLNFFKNIHSNIIFSTHSPFILSDIPSQNILKLENGKPKPNDSINSFAANIYDLLNDEFFLKNGAVGAYAQNYINTIICNIEKINPDTDKKIINELKSKIAIIGDELIRYGLEEHLFEKLKSPEFEIEILEERIKELKAKNLNNEKN